MQIVQLFYQNQVDILNTYLQEHPNYIIHSITPLSDNQVWVVFNIKEDRSLNEFIRKLP